MSLGSKKVGRSSFQSSSPYLRTVSFFTDSFSPFSLSTLIVVLLFFFLFRILLSLAGVYGSSEARELEVSRNVLEGANWFFPLRHGVVPSKPPLMHWVTALIAVLFQQDISPALQRLVSLSSAVGTMLLTWWICLRLERKIYADRCRGAVASLSIFILGSSYLFFRLALDARVDMLFSFLVCGAICSFVLPLCCFEKDSRGQEPHYTFFAFCSALAVLTKGPLGILLPLMICFILLAAVRGVGNAMRALLKPRWQWVLFVAIALPWYLLGCVGEADGFSQRYIFENTTRFFGGEHIVSKPPWYYLKTLIGRVAPWSLLLPFFFIAAWNDRKEMFYKQLWPFILWFVVGLGFFSLASGKRHPYLLPLLPSLSIFLAFWLHQLWQRASDVVRRRCYSTLNGLHVLLLIFAATMLCLFDSHRVFVFDTDPLIQTSAQWVHMYLFSHLLPFVLLFFALLFLARKFSSLRVSLIALSTVLFCLFVVNVGYGMKAHLKGFSNWADRIRAALDVDQALTVMKEPHDEFFDPVLFYLDRQVVFVAPGERAERLPCKTLFLTREESVLKEDIILDSFQLLSDKVQKREDRRIVLARRDICTINP